MDKKKDTKNAKDYIISYNTLRRSVGILGIALPLIMVVGSIALDNENQILNSISSYAHLRIGNGFVGILCAVSLFMFSYLGYDYKDNIAGHLAGIFALGIAFFPNNTCDPSTIINKLHLISASLFFLTLIYFSLRLFPKSDKDKKDWGKPKKNRNKVYYTCGFTMLGALLSVAVIMIWFKNVLWLMDLDPVFWFETIMLVAFGISWITKGQMIFKDLEDDLKEETI